jgi:hypothetical protein
MGTCVSLPLLAIAVALLAACGGGSGPSVVDAAAPVHIGALASTSTPGGYASTVLGLGGTDGIGRFNKPGQVAGTATLAGNVHFHAFFFDGTTLIVPGSAGRITLPPEAVHENPCASFWSSVSYPTTCPRSLSAAVVESRPSADAWSWMRISGDEVRLAGIGSLNGVAGYSFVLTAVDGALSGAGTSDDRFRLRISHATTAGEIVDYDNGLETLGGGNIVIHRS